MTDSRKNILYVSLYVFGILFIFRNWFGNFSTHMAGDPTGDSTLILWQMYWPYLKLKSFFIGAALPAYLDGNSFGGIQGSYAFSDMMPGLFPVVSVLDLLFHSPIATVNTIHLISLILLPVSIFLYSGRYFEETPYRFLSGLFTLFLQYNFDMLQHLQMQFVFAIPLSQYFLNRWLSDRQKTRFLAASLFFHAFLAMTSGHLFLYGILFCALESSLRIYYSWKNAHFKFVLAEVLNPAGSPGYSLRTAVIAAAFISTAYLSLSPYHTVQKKYNISRLKTESIYGAARLNDFSIAPDDLLLKGKIEMHERALKVHPAGIFLFFCGFFYLISLRKKGILLPESGAIILTKSFLASILFLISAANSSDFKIISYLTSDILFVFWPLYAAFIYIKKRKLNIDSGKYKANESSNILPIMSIFFFFCALGPLPALQNITIPYISPYNLLYEFFPGFSRIRASSRIIILFWIVFGIVSSYGIKFLYLSVSQKTRLYKIIFQKAILPMTAMISFIYAVPLQWQPTGNPGQYNSINEFFQSRANSNSHLPLLFASNDEEKRGIETISQLISAVNYQTIMGGYSGIGVDPYEYLSYALNSYKNRKGLWKKNEIESLLIASGSGDAIEYNSKTKKVSVFIYKNKINTNSIIPLCRTKDLTGSFRMDRRIPLRHGLIVAYRPEGAFCVNEYGNFQDRRLDVVWSNADIHHTENLFISTPFYHHPHAPEFFYAADTPHKRGNYRVTIQENDKTLLSGDVEIY